MAKIFFVLLLTTLMPFVAQAIKMGGPGFPTDQGEWIMAGEIGYRSYDFHDNGSFDKVDSVEFGGRVGYAITKWLQPQLLLGGATASRSSDDFKGNLGPQFGLLMRFVPVQTETDTSGRIAISLDLGGRWQGLSGSRPDSTRSLIEAKGDLWEAVAGLTFSFCTERTCAYGGGRYSYLALREGVSLDKHLGGVYGGVDYFVTPAVFFNVEAQNFDADAIYGGVGARF